MIKVLIIIPYYYPGFRSGGPQQTIKNLADAFSTNENLYIYTQNHDMGVSQPYENIEIEKWYKDGNVHIMYEKPVLYCGKKLEELYEEFEMIYSCGLFEKNTIHLLRIHNKNRKDKKIYIAPMGVFSEGALKSKYIKKKVFLLFFKKFGFFKNIIWSFTSEFEVNEAKKALGNQYINQYIIAEDLPRKIDFKEQKKLIDNKKYSDTLKIVFLSRICSMKNLRYCIEILNYNFLHNIVFDIYGTIEDNQYWKECMDLIKFLPECVTVNYIGEVMPKEVFNIFSKYDLFLFPTKGENYGHVIYEALASGCIPIISNMTPWSDLEEHECGFAIPLGDTNSFRKSIEFYMGDVEKRRSQSANCLEYAYNKYMQSTQNSGYVRVING